MGGYCSSRPYYRVTAYFIQLMSYGAGDRASLSGMRDDKGRGSGSDRTFCRSLEAAALYLCAGTVCACCRNLAVSASKGFCRVDEEVPDGNPAVYDCILYIQDGALFSRCAAGDLLSI